MDKKVIIIGASSGIGKELAKVFSEKGFIVGLTARRIELLKELQKELPTKSFVKQMDLYDVDASILTLKELFEEMQNVDVVIINSGTGHNNPQLEWEKERPSIDVNVRGCTAMAVTAANYFIKKRQGHIVGISSVSAIAPYRTHPAYGASKAFMSFYLKGLRFKFFKEGYRNIYVTDVKPGFVLTPLTEQNEHMFWVASAPKAAKQIYDAVISRKEHVYVTKRWALIAFLMKITPAFIYKRL